MFRKETLPLKYVNVEYEIFKRNFGICIMKLRLPLVNHNSTSPRPHNRRPIDRFSTDLPRKIIELLFAFCMRRRCRNCDGRQMAVHSNKSPPELS